MQKKHADIGYIDVTIPKDVENIQLPNPELLTYYKNLEDRVLWIDDEICDYSLEYARLIMNWNREDKGKDIEERKPITLLFFSPGGDLSVNHLLVDTIAMSTTPVVGINCGMAASAACFIYLSCHKRYTFPNAEFLIHQGAGSFDGTYDQVVAAIINYQEEIEKLGEFVLSRTNIDEDLFNENFSTDWYINAEDAVKYGISEKIVKSLDEVI